VRLPSRSVNGSEERKVVQGQTEKEREGQKEDRRTDREETQR
jgi:hypothetical protein